MKIKSIHCIRFILKIYIMSHLNYFIQCFLLFFLSITVNAIENNLKVNRLNLNLSHNTVTTIFQDSRGYMWLGTLNGLNRYDGNSVKIYEHNPLDSASLSNSRIYKIAEDQNGNLWIATDNGLNCYNESTDNFIHYFNQKDNNRSLTQNLISDVKVDAKGKIWVACSDLCLFNPATNNFTRFTIKTSGLPNPPNSDHNFIYEDKSGRIWYVYWQDIYYFDIEKQNTVLYYDGYKNPLSKRPWNFYDMVQDKEGYYWISTYNAGLFRFEFNPLSPKFVLFNDYIGNEEYLSNDRLLTIREDSKGYLWISRENSGLLVFNQQKKLKFRLMHDPDDKGTIGFNSIWSIFEDKCGRIWLGTWDAGVDVIDPYEIKFEHFYNKKGQNNLTHNQIKSILPDKSGNLWIATDGGGLNYFIRKENKFISYRHNVDYPYSLSTDAILALCIDNDGDIWAGTWNGGLNVLKKSTEKIIHYNTANSGLSANNIFALLNTDQNKIFIGTWFGGLSIFDKKTRQWETYMPNSSDKKSIISNLIYCLYQDHKGDIWIGTFSGLELFKRDSAGKGYFIHYQNNINDKSSLSSGGVEAIYEDKENRFWVGTQNGLDLFNRENGTCKLFTKANGLPNNSICGIIGDTHGILWISTYKGFARFDPESDSCRNYDVTDGLQGYQFNRGALCITPSGELAFGGTNGFNIFNPDSIKDNPFAPQITFVDFMLFNKSVPIGKNSVLKKHINQTEVITLHHKQSVFSFEFVALNYTHPEKNNYAYMLEGFEKNWNYVGSKREATYTNLDPGEYIFRVRASNNDGLWNNKGISVKIIILPPWWMTWWFRISLFLLIAGSAVSFYFIRINQIKRQKRVLEKQVELRTKQLKEANINLSQQKEEILTQNEEILQQSEELAAQRDALEMVNKEITTKNEQISKAYENMKILSDFGQRITSTLSLESINNMIFDYVSSLMDTYAFGIGLYNKNLEKIEFHLFFEHGIRLPYFERSIDEANSLSAYCIKNRKEIYMNNVNIEYSNYISEKPVHRTSETPKSIITLPLSVKENIIGLITVNSTRINAYSQNDFTNLQSLASYISIALENASIYQVLNKQNEHIKSSIEYAKNIQNSILPVNRILDKHFDSFILFRPKDIVSGDFYWFTTVKNDKDDQMIFIAVVDCTGHGVPGAFMSLIGNRLLSEIVNEKRIFSPAQILEFMNVGIQIALRQDETKNNDGMDVGLCRIEYIDNKVKIIFSGAKRPLCFYKKGTNDISVIRGSHKSIGGIRAKRSKLFYENYEIELDKGDIIYLFSDGYIDQNSFNRIKLGSKKLYEILLEIKDMEMEEQRKNLEDLLSAHMINTDQRDDITFVGIRL